MDYQDAPQGAQERGLTSEQRKVPAVSVIIPVYNVERYLEQCLESVCSQTLDNLEIICVNDGSRDGSLKIMRSFAERDTRVVVIDKPNGGYGKAVNRGFAEAHGEYLAVLEPDDFIDCSMYADLYAAAVLADGTKADVVKSSYWEYYDLEGEESYLKAPNLMNCMPRYSFSFTVKTHWEVMYHHPSIWSAIYRRDFIEDKNIRMIEPKGAGWADNPFFFETLLQAQSIVWVPAAYYYYRQTNPGASSNLRDYHLPFDRLRDIRGVLTRLDVDDPHLLVCFYNRIFSYIGTVINEEGFPESDPEIFALIKEALGYIDRRVLYGAHHGIKKEHRAYYDDVMGVRAKHIKERPASDNPELSVVVAMHDCRASLWDTLESIAQIDDQDIEVLCVDCASRDRSLEVARTFAAKDRRFSVTAIDEPELAAGRNAALEVARGSHCLFLRVGMKLDSFTVRALVTGARAHVTADIIVFDGRLSVLRGNGPVDEPWRDGTVTRLGAYLTGGRTMLASKLFSTEFLKRETVRFDANDLEDCPAFCLEAVWAATSFAALEGVHVNDTRLRLHEEINTRATGLLAREERVFERMDVIARGFGDEAMRAFRNYLVIRLADDMRRYGACRDAETIFNRLLELFSNAYGLSEYGGTYYLDQAAYQRLVSMKEVGFQATVLQDLWGSRQHSQHLDQQVEDLRKSKSYRLGNAVVRRVKRIKTAFE